MAMYRKLGKATKPRRALLRNQVTALLYNGKIITTEARAKEIKKIVEPMITLAAKEKDKDGKRVKEVVDGKKVTKYTTVKKEIKKDLPSRMHARRQLLKTLYPVTEVPTENAGRKKNTKEVDLVAKLFDEYGPKYADRKGGYTRMIKIGQRKGDAAMMVVLELV